MGWGLGLADLKTIAINSLNYSAMTSREKKFAMEIKWKPTWDAYIATMKAVACKRNYIAEGMREREEVPTFAQIAP